MPERNGPGRHDPVVPFGRPIHRNGAGPRPPADLPTRPLRRIEAEESVDLVAVQADDELLTALAAGMAVSAPGSYGYDTDDHVAAILASWKAEVDEEPIPELIDLDTAVDIVRAAAGAASPLQRRRRLVPVAAAATAAVIALSGITVGSAAAEPGGVFWPVSKVLFSERAASIEAADRAEDHITRAKAALTEGRSDVAAMELRQAQTELGQVRPQEGKDQLVEVQAFLVAKADETPPGVAADPGAPLRRDRSRKVPQGAALTQDPDPSAGGAATTTPAPVTTTVDPVAPQPAPPPQPASPAPTSDPTPEPTSTATPEGGKDSAPGTSTTGMGAPTEPTATPAS